MRLSGVAALMIFTALVAVAPAPAQDTRRASGLTPFSSDEELAEYLRVFWATRNAALKAQAAEWQLAAEMRRQVAAERRAERERACGAGATVSRRSSATATASTPALLVGRVLTAEGQPVPGANVAVPTHGLGTMGTSTGDFQLVVPAHHLTSDSVSLTARFIGYMPVVQRVRVTAGDTVRVDFTLCADLFRLEEAVVTGAASVSADGITNVQHEGVDEGGIVKKHGDFLVLLRRGRLFTVKIGRNELRPVAVINAYGPGVDASGTWLDEILVIDDKVIVIGFSYDRGGTEIGIFHIDIAGGLKYLSTYHLRSNDYYSARNYASRLVGRTLVFYTPSNLREGATDIRDVLPALRKWDVAVGSEGPFKSITAVRNIYRPPTPLDSMSIPTLHSVTRCELVGAELVCSSATLLGPSSRVTYISPTATYVWSSRNTTRTDTASSMLYRLPLDGSRPQAVGVRGAPFDQFSFLESGDGFLNVLTSTRANSDWMWQAENATGHVRLLRMPLRAFGDGRSRASRARYRYLGMAPEPPIQNRFVGGHVLYGTGIGWGLRRRSGSVLTVAPWRGREIVRLALPHTIDRIEAMGGDALIVGSDRSDLHFSAVSLANPAGMPIQRLTLDSASQAETRSHGFYYRATSRSGGVLGLPVRKPAGPARRQLFASSSAILFLRNDSRKLTSLGGLAAQPEPTVIDRCIASCVDWYGNSRPIFVGSRVLALMGYEIVEGAIAEGRIDEVRRINYRTPPALPSSGR